LDRLDLNDSGGGGRCEDLFECLGFVLTSFRAWPVITWIGRGGTRAFWETIVDWARGFSRFEHSGYKGDFLEAGLLPFLPGVA